MEARWIIKEERFGKFDLKHTICGTDDLQNAYYIIKSMVESHKGQPVRYKAFKAAQDYIPAYDDPILETCFEDMTFDYSAALDWQYCLGDNAEEE